MNYRTKTLMMMHKALHSRDDVDKTYVQKKKKKRRKTCKNNSKNYRRTNKETKMIKSRRQKWTEINYIDCSVNYAWEDDQRFLDRRNARRGTESILKLRMTP